MQRGARLLSNSVNGFWTTSALKMKTTHALAVY